MVLSPYGHFADRKSELDFRINKAYESDKNIPVMYDALFEQYQYKIKHKRQSCIPWKTNNFGLLRNCGQQGIDYCGIVVLNKSSFSLSITIERGE